MIEDGGQKIAKTHKPELLQKIPGIHPSLFCVAKAMQNKKSYGGQVNPGQAEEAQKARRR